MWNRLYSNNSFLNSLGLHLNHTARGQRYVSTYKRSCRTLPHMSPKCFFWKMYRVSWRRGQFVFFCHQPWKESIEMAAHWTWSSHHPLHLQSRTRALSLWCERVESRAPDIWWRKTRDDLRLCWVVEIGIGIENRLQNNTSSSIVFHKINTFHTRTFSLSFDACIPLEAGWLP